MIFKNIASQKWIVFAYNVTTGLPETGDAANITAEISIDGAAGSATNDVNPTELEDGYYVFDLTQAETNGDLLTILPESTTSNIVVIGAPATAYTREETPDVNVLQISGDATAADNAESFFDGTGYAGTNNVIPTVTTLTGHTPQTGDNFARLGAPAGASVSADIATVDTVVDGIQTDLDNGVDGLGAIKSAINDISSITPLASGTAQGGTSNTIQLASSETFADDELKGNVVSIISGTGAGQTKVITAYTGATDTATVTPNWTTIPDATSVYEIIPGSVNLASWLSAAPAALVGSGWVKADMSSTGPAVIVAGSFAAGAIDANALAANAVDEIRDAILADSISFNGADIAEILNDTSDIQPKLGTVSDLGGGSTISNNLSDMAGSTFDGSTDSQEAIRNRGDAAWAGAGASATGFTIIEKVNHIDTGELDTVFLATSAGVLINTTGLPNVTHIFKNGVEQNAAATTALGLSIVQAQDDLAANITGMYRLTSTGVAANTTFNDNLIIIINGVISGNTITSMLHVTIEDNINSRLTTALTAQGYTSARATNLDRLDKNISTAQTEILTGLTKPPTLP